jgi:hypothetical protein
VTNRTFFLWTPIEINLYYFLRKVFPLILNKNEVASFNLFEHKFTLDLNLQFLLTFLCIHDLKNKKTLKKIDKNMSDTL